MDVEMEGHRYQKNPQDIKDVQRLEKKDKEGRTLRSLQFDVPNAISTICWYGLRYAGVFSPERHHNILLLVASVQAESMEFQQFEVNLCMAHGTRRSGTIFLATKPDTFI